MGHDPVAIVEKQLHVWDRSDDPRWRLTIYEPLYGGKIFANIGGMALLDYAGAYAGLGPKDSCLELGCGMGDACEYVASHFGCRVTGVEMSTHQIERARARHPDRRSRGFDFVQADLMKWEPSESYDLVYWGDMMAVVQDRRSVLEKMHRALRPRGAFVITDITAGHNLTDEEREALWEEDGANDLPFPEDSLALIRDVGFQDLEVVDLTHTVVTLQETILQESYRHKATLIDAVGFDNWQGWVDASINYRRLFAERKLISIRIGSHRA